MSGPLRPRIILLAAALVGTSAYVLTTRDPTTRNVQDRFSAAGGAVNHTPARGTKMGDVDNVAPRRQEGGSGVGTKKFEENIRDQRGEPGLVEKKWNKRQYGTESGK